MNSLENEEKSSITSHEKKVNYEPFYGDVTELNTCRIIMDSVGKETLNPSSTTIF